MTMNTDSANSANSANSARSAAAGSARTAGPGKTCQNCYANRIDYCDKGPFCGAFFQFNVPCAPKPYKYAKPYVSLNSQKEMLYFNTKHDSWKDAN